MVESKVRLEEFRKTTERVGKQTGKTMFRIGEALERLGNSVLTKASRQGV